MKIRSIQRGISKKEVRRLFTKGIWKEQANGWYYLERNGIRAVVSADNVAVTIYRISFESSSEDALSSQQSSELRHNPFENVLELPVMKGRLDNAEVEKDCESLETHSDEYEMTYEEYMRMGKKKVS